MKYVVWALIAFGLYSGFKFLPLVFTKSSVTHAVERELGGINDGLSDEVLRKRIVRSARVASVELDPSKISIQRERHTGERVFQIAIELPITVEDLGKERVFDSVVHVNRTVPVDEAAEARRVATKKRYDDRVGRINAANDKLLGALRKCEERTGGKCQATGGAGQFMAPDDIEIIENY